MRIKNQEIMSLSKINLDLDMLIILILKNTALEITGVEEDSLLEKQLVGLQQVQSQK